LPLFYLQDNEPMQLSFDELDSELQTYHYALLHCDANWRASDLQPQDYLGGSIRMNKQTSGSEIPQHLHYSVVFPNENMQIKLAGNYAIIVYEAIPPITPCMTARMYVRGSQGQHVTARFTRPPGIEDKKFKQEVDFQILTTNSYNRQPLQRHQNLHPAELAEG
jgi:hypothetical protein